MVDWAGVIAGIVAVLMVAGGVLLIVVVGRRNDRERVKYYQRTGKWPLW
jgi:hypothetical protein